MKTTLYYLMKLSTYDGEFLPIDKDCFNITGFNESIAGELKSLCAKHKYKENGVWEFTIDHNPYSEKSERLKEIIEMVGNEGSNVDLEGKYISSDIESNTWTECDSNGIACILDSSHGSVRQTSSSQISIATTKLISDEKKEKKGKKAKKAQHDASNKVKVVGLLNKPKMEKSRNSSVKNKLAALLERNK